MKIDFTKLLGFDTVSHELSAGVDLRDDTLGSKLGAKVGGTEDVSPEKRLIDFQDETLGAKLGAKVDEPQSGV